MSEPTDSTSESENPAIEAPEPHPHRPRTNRDWWENDKSVVENAYAASQEVIGR